MRRADIWAKAALGIAAAVLWGAGALAQTPASDDANRDAEKKIHDLCVEKLGDDAEPIRAMVTGDKAILAGEVTSRPVRHLATEVARAVPGIRDVDNQVTLARSLPLTGKVKEDYRDTKLEITAKARLESQVGGAVARALEVEAVDGWVSLRGTVPDEMRKDLAIDSVRKIDGVVKVVDLISVAK